MIEFYAFSWAARIGVVFILGVCVLSQTITLVINFYRQRMKTLRILEALFELAMLCEILLLSFLYGQVVNGYKNGFVVPTGYENIRIFLFFVVLMFIVIIIVLRKDFLPLTVTPSALISLPIIENFLGHAFPWIFVIALILFLGRSLKVSIFSLKSIRTSISSLSIVHAVNSLHTGVLFSENDGYMLLSNRQMQNLMLAITGQTFRSSLQFYDMLASDQYASRYKKMDMGGQMVYLLPDETAWMFTKTDIPFSMENYIHLSATDVSEQWALTSKLQVQAQKLKHKSDELKRTIANLYTLSKEKEIENAKVRIHDILGQRLTVLLRTIQDDRNLDYDLLTSLSKGLLAELKADQSEVGPYEELNNIQKIFNAIGVEINFEGQLPDNNDQADLFVDIIREASTNAVRHGFATEIKVKFEQKENQYHLTISNNGHTATAPIIPGGGIGGMKKQVDIQGGRLDVTQNPLFTITVVLPGGNQYE